MKTNESYLLSVDLTLTCHRIELKLEELPRLPLAWIGINFLLLFILYFHPSFQYWLYYCDRLLLLFLYFVILVVVLSEFAKKLFPALLLLIYAIKRLKPSRIIILQWCVLSVEGWIRRIERWWLKRGVGLQLLLLKGNETLGHVVALRWRVLPLLWLDLLRLAQVWFVSLDFPPNFVSLDFLSLFLLFLL